MLKCCMIIQQIVKDFITLHQVLAEKCNLKSLYIHAVMVQSVGAFDMHAEGLVFKTKLSSWQQVRVSHVLRNDHINQCPMSLLNDHSAQYEK